MAETEHSARLAPTITGTFSVPNRHINKINNSLNKVCMTFWTQPFSGLWSQPNEPRYVIDS